MFPLLVSKECYHIISKELAKASKVSFLYGEGVKSCSSETNSSYMAGIMRLEFSDSLVTIWGEILPKDKA